MSAKVKWFCLLLPAGLQLLCLPTFDLGVDEAHYMLYARFLDWSYFDHPPLVGWVHFLFNSVFGENLLSARLPAILIGVFSSVQIFKFLREQGFAEEASAVASLALGLCFQFFVLDFFLLPDTLCLALIWPLMRATVRVAEKPTIRSWLLLGLCLGLMGLAKYTAVFFLVPVGGLILWRQRLAVFRQPGFYLAVVLALVLVSPVLFWNSQRDWISLRFQGGHVLGEEHGLEGFLKSLGLQVALYSPFLWGFSLWGFWKLAKRTSAAARFAFLTSFTFGAFFLWSSWKATVLPHWPALFYFFSIPWGVAALYASRKRVVQTMVGLTAAVVLALTVSLVSGWGFRIPGALKEVGGWPEFMPELQRRLKEPREALAFLNWTYGSRALYHAPGFETRIFILDDRVTQFDLWNRESPEGRDLLLVQFSFDQGDFSKTVRCQNLGPEERIPVVKRGSELYEVIVRRCENAKPLISPAGS